MTGGSRQETLKNCAPIVVEIPSYLKPFADAVRGFVAVAEDTVRKGRGGASVDYGAVERLFAEHGAKIEAGAHKGTLEALDVDAPYIEVRGRRYARIGRTPGHYRTLAGEVVVERAVYRELGIRNGPSVDAISLRTGAIADGWLPQTARAMALHLQQGTSRDAEMLTSETGRLPYSRSSFERVPHEVGALLLEHHATIEDELIREFEMPREAASVSVGMDRVSIPMEEPRERPVGRPRKGAAKRPISRQFRMAYVGAVTIHDANGEALRTIRYGCMPQGDPRALANAMANDIYHLVRLRRSLKVSLLADGALEMWALLEGEINEETIGKAVKSLIDFWHAIEKLMPAAKVIYGDGARDKLTNWKDALRARSGGAKEILAELEASGCEHTFLESKQPVHDAITYLRHNADDRMNYASALRNGLPIGSGNTEATCKTLVAVRMKRAGSRWKETTGEHILRLRAWAQSDRWNDAMERLLATQRTSVRRAG